MSASKQICLLFYNNGRLQLVFKKLEVMSLNFEPNYSVNGINIKILINATGPITNLYLLHTAYLQLSFLF